MTSGSAALFLGVDGGGSGCRARLIDRHGRVLGAAEGGAANVYLAFDTAMEHIRNAVATALASAGVSGDAWHTVRVGLGLAGASSRGVAERVEGSLPGFGHVVAGHDGWTACLGAHAGRDGGLVIAGTGSVAVLNLDGRMTGIGGRGFVLGDDGSGAWIGRSIWRRALRAHDGLDPPSPVLAALMADFDDDPVRVITWARAAPSHAFAGYAPRVFQAARAGDPAAGSVIQEAAAAIEELILALVRKGAPRVSLVGGLATSIEPYLSPPCKAGLAAPLADALQGAAILAGWRSPEGDGSPA